MNRDKCIPAIGEQVLVLNHLGTFVVEEVDALAKSANLRVQRSGVLMKDVSWRAICPLDDEVRAQLENIFTSAEFQRLISDNDNRTE